MKGERRFPRFTVEGVQGSLGLRAHVQLLDLSVGGAALKSNRELHVGAEYILRFALEKESVSVKAVVVRSALSLDPNERGETAPEHLAGLRFTAVLAGTLQGLRRYIDGSKVGEERRLSGVRVQIKAQSEAVLDSFEIYRVRLISLSGMLIETDHRLELEGVHSMEILPPGQETISFRGRVASCQEVPFRAPGRSEVGIGFLDMSPEDTSKLKIFINSIARG
jgi:hypothetical protein